MRYAKDNAGNEITATPGAVAVCLSCREAVFAKCGPVTGWHWCHKAGSLCVHAATEPESAWHHHWKSEVPHQYREVTVRKHGRVKRADIKAKTKTVIELQHSDITRGELDDREQFYGRNMFWIFDSDGRSRCISRLYGGGQEKWNGLQQYVVRLPDRVPGVGAARRAALVDLGDYVCRVVPHAMNCGTEFRAVVLPAERVREAVKATCNESDAVVANFLIGESRGINFGKKQSAVASRGSISKGEYISDYCQHVRKVTGQQDEYAEVRGVPLRHEDRVRLLQKKGWNLLSQGKPERAISGDLKTMRLCVKMTRYSRHREELMFMDVSDGTCLVAWSLADLSFEDMLTASAATTPRQAGIAQLPMRHAGDLFGGEISP